VEQDEDESDDGQTHSFLILSREDSSMVNNTVQAVGALILLFSGLLKLPVR
jgi:hypothetical protein